MIQKKYVFQTMDELDSIASKITENDAYRTATGVLIQFYNPRIDLDEEGVLSFLHEHCSKARTIGITDANIADVAFDIKDRPAELNVIYFRTTRLVPMEFDMNIVTGFAAGCIIDERLQKLTDAKGILLCYSCGSGVIQSFMQEFRHHHLPIFGAKAGRSIRALNTAHVYGKKAHANGISAIIFSGKDLRLYMDNCLGFREIGVEMMVTGTEGDTVITEIDHKPAVEVYSKYLNVKPNQYFVHNVCEFPLVFHRNDCVIARVPSAHGEDGSIHFTSNVVKGAKFRLSYGNSDQLLQIIDQSAGDMEKFRPEAVLLFECGNRIRFLKEQAEQERKRFREISPELSVGLGYAELFYTNTGNGGTLNSALVAVGLTEDPSATSVMRSINNCVDEETSVEEDGRDVIPFVDRILHFLETTSKELDDLNRKLGKIAYTDQLTRIYNRWELEHKIKEIVAFGETDHSPVSLIFMDIDHFKNVNDTFGHDVGDLVLKGTVELIKENLKPEYVFGRWGGEEFLCTLPNVNVVEARKFAEELRRVIDENCFIKVQHVTMSFGVTERIDGDTMDSLVKRADRALYMAKEGGRNRVIFI